MPIERIGGVPSLAYDIARAAAQEAHAKTTLTEDAAHGDEDAIRKLADEERQNDTPRSSPPGVGQTIDFLA